jgi:hypothetical protein
MAMFPQLPQTLQQDNDQNDDDIEDPMALRRELGGLTPAQIMKIPSAEQIFGLAEKPADAQNNPALLENNAGNATNVFGADPAAAITEPNWANVWTGNIGNSSSTGDSGQSSNTTDRASGFFGGFFDTARNNSLNNGLFANHNGGNDVGTLFAPSQPAPQQSSWASVLTSGVGTPPASAAEPSPANFTAPGAAPELTSQSPFAAPEVSRTDMGALPQLPTLPTLPGQNDRLAQPATPPSWAPQPPPWTQSQTPLGTPLNIQTLKR